VVRISTTRSTPPLALVPLPRTFRRAGGRPAATCTWGVRSVSQIRRRSRYLTGRPVGRTDEFGTCGPSKTAACRRRLAGRRRGRLMAYCPVLACSALSYLNEMRTFVR
jgi:hypothetical protein